MGLFGYFLPKFLNNVKIIKGKYYKCLKTVNFLSLTVSDFIEGKLYISEREGYITGEVGIDYDLSKVPEFRFLEYFMPYYNHKRKSKFLPPQKPWNPYIW